MPYIAQGSTRTYLEQNAKMAVGLSSGSLAFLLTRIGLEWLGDAHSFERLATLRGIFEEVIDEFRRRVTVPYEEGRRRLNGDAF